MYRNSLSQRPIASGQDFGVVQVALRLLMSVIVALAVSWVLIFLAVKVSVDHDRVCGFSDSPFCGWSETQEKYTSYGAALHSKVIFTFMHLADAFIQSNLQYIQVIHFFCQYVQYGENSIHLASESGNYKYIECIKCPVNKINLIFLAQGNTLSSLCAFEQESLLK